MPSAPVTRFLLALPLAWAACTSAPSPAVAPLPDGGDPWGVTADGGTGLGASSGAASSGGASSSGEPSTSATVVPSTSAPASGSSGAVSGASSATAPSSGTLPGSSSAAAPSSSGTLPGSSSGPPGPACGDTDDCDAGHVCIQGFCVPGCFTEDTCPAYAPQCNPDTPPHGACVECLGVDDCGWRQNCVEGFCRVSCGPGGGCGWDMVCRTVDNVCVECLGADQCDEAEVCDPASATCQPAPETCWGDPACGAGAVCLGGECVPGCRASPDTCPPGAICHLEVGETGTCLPGCRQAEDCGDPNAFLCLGGVCVPRCQSSDECPRGTYCSNAGTCDPGCATSDDCWDRRLPACHQPTHTCVECLEAGDCPEAGDGYTSTCSASNLCVTSCNASGGWDACWLLGMSCDPVTRTCVECTGQEECGPFEQCVENRCRALGGRPLCAACDADDQCGGNADLCVRITVLSRQERVCGVDCAQGQPCPAGTTCQTVGGGSGQPPRGVQCLPQNSVGLATCAARRDLVDQEACTSGDQCGLMGGLNNRGEGDAICSGAGASQGHCSVFCGLDATDCPEGFFCEDPPPVGGRDYSPRCSPL